MRCTHCGSEKTEQGIAWGKSTEAGNVGLKYKEGIFVGVVQTYSDLCLDCGTILRSYIKEDTNKRWVKTPGSLGSK